MASSLFRGFRPNLVIVSLVGSSFHLVIVTLTNWFGSIDFFSFIGSSRTSFTLFPLSHNTFFVLVLLLGALAAPRLETSLSKTSKSVFFFAPSLMLLLGILSIVMTSYYYSPALEILSGMLLAAGCASNFLLYQRTFYTFVDQNPSIAASVVIGGTGLAALLYFLVSWLPPIIVIIILVAVFIPGACAAPLLCRRFGEWNPPEPKSQESPDVLRYKDAFKSLVMACVSIALIALLWRFLRILSVNEGHIVLVNNLGSFGRLFSAIVLMAILVFNKYQIRMDVFYRWALPVIGTAFLLLPFFGWWYNMILISLIYCLFSIASMIAILAFNQVAYSFRVLPISVFGLGYGFFHLISIAGSTILSVTIGEAYILGAFQSKLVFALIVLYVFFMLFVLSSRVEQRLKTGAWSSEKLSVADDTDKTGDIGDTGDTSDTSDTDKAASTRKENCATLRKQFNLTAKEGEVLGHLASGYRVSNIALLMVISENTVNFHIKNIYRKFGIHNMHDLHVLLDNGSGIETDW